MLYILRYWRHVLARAALDSAHFLGFPTPSKFSISLALFSVAVVVLSRFGWGNQTNEELRWGLATLAAAVTFFVPLLILNLLATPARLAEEAKKVALEALSEAEDKKLVLLEDLHKYRAKQEVANQLAAFYRDGYILLSKKIKPGEIAQWEGEFSTWGGSLASYVEKKISLPASVHLAVTHTSSEKQVTFAWAANKEHNDRLAIHFEELKKLEAFLFNYQTEVEALTKGH